ncbi:MAG: SDR family oxidoreductase [Anaerolineae bacterium]
MLGKVCLITGATSGIGKSLAKALAAMNATMVLVGRSEARAEATMTEIAVQTKNPHIEYLIADLSRPAEVRRLAEEFRQRYARLDVLVNNAGAIFGKRQESADGIEMTFALNHLSYFLLTTLLLDALKAGAAALGKPARVVNISAGAHFAGHLDFNDLQNKRFYNGWRAYAASKLANVLFTYELARRVDAAQIVTNAVHPGVVATRFGRGDVGLTSLFFKLSRPFLLSPEKGADTPLYLATSDEIEGTTSRYFEKRRAVKSSFTSYDVDSARRLWDISEHLTAAALTS